MSHCSELKPESNIGSPCQVESTRTYTISIVTRQKGPLSDGQLGIRNPANSFQHLGTEVTASQIRLASSFDVSLAS